MIQFKLIIFYKEKNDVDAIKHNDLLIYSQYSHDLYLHWSHQ